MAFDNVPPQNFKEHILPANGLIDGPNNTAMQSLFGNGRHVHSLSFSSRRFTHFQDKPIVTYCNKGVTGNTVQNILINKELRKTITSRAGITSTRFKREARATNKNTARPDCQAVLYEVKQYVLYAAIPKHIGSHKYIVNGRRDCYIVCVGRCSPFDILVHFKRLNQW